MHRYMCHAILINSLLTIVPTKGFHSSRTAQSFGQYYWHSMDVYIVQRPPIIAAWGIPALVHVCSFSLSRWRPATGHAGIYRACLLLGIGFSTGTTATSLSKVRRTLPLPITFKLLDDQTDRNHATSRPTRTCLHTSIWSHGQLHSPLTSHTLLDFRHTSFPAYGNEHSRYLDYTCVLENLKISCSQTINPTKYNTSVLFTQALAPM